MSALGRKLWSLDRLPEEQKGFLNNTHTNIGSYTMDSGFRAFLRAALKKAFPKNKSL